MSKKDTNTFDPMIHSPTKTFRKSGGENLYACMSYTVGGTKSCDPVASWYSEIQYMSNNIIHSFASQPSPEIIGHFTPIVWERASRIGCSRVTVKKTQIIMERSWYICQYDGPGTPVIYDLYSTTTSCPGCSFVNLIGSKVYEYVPGVTTFQTSWLCDDTTINSKYTKRGQDPNYKKLCGNPNVARENY